MGSSCGWLHYDPDVRDCKIGLTLPADIIRASPGFGAKILYDVNLVGVDLGEFIKNPSDLSSLSQHKVINENLCFVLK